MQGLGGAGERAGIRLLWDDLSDAQKIAISVDDGKLSKAPRLIFQDIHAWNTCTRQLAGCEGAVNALHIQDTDVAAGG